MAVASKVAGPLAAFKPLRCTRTSLSSRDMLAMTQEANERWVIVRETAAR